MLKDCWRNLRTILKTPVLSLVIVATLALGFGANIAIFSVLRSVVMRGFPYRDAGRVALVWLTNPQLGYSEYFMSSPDLRDLAAENRSFETMGHYGFGFVNLTGSGTPEALLGAWIGGVTLYSVVRQTREIGIRMALGASRGRILQQVFGQALRMVMAGAVLGIGASLMATRLIARLLYGVKPVDAGVFMAAPVLLGLAAVAATYLPARRAIRTEPADALRME